MILDSTSRTLEIVLAEAKATTDCDITACYATTDTTTTFALNARQTVSNGTSAVTVVNAPAYGQTVQVNEVRLHNGDTVAHTVVLRFNDNGTAISVLMEQIIAAGGDFLYTPQTGAPVAGGGGGSGTVTSIATGAGLTGGPITNSGTVALAAIAAGDLLANIGTAAAAPSPTALTGLLDAALGNTQGDILFRSGTAWAVLAPGTAGQFLQTGGLAANPAWAAPTGGGTVTNIATSGGIHGGPITGSGTLTVDWSGGTVTALGAGLLLNSGTLSSRGAGWDGPITATGSTQAGAYAITAAVSYFATVAPGTGGVLPAAPTAGDRYETINAGANALAVYPPSGATIDGGAANASVLVLAGGSARFFATASTAWISR